MLKVFIGYDPRQPISLNVLSQSIYRKSSKPVAITPLVIEQLPMKRVGLTPFTYSRFLAPYLCNYEGWSLFLDADILLNADIAELFALADDKYTVMVSKNEQRFEWASVMLFNNRKCGILTPEYIEKAQGLHGIQWANEEEVGELPGEWNHLVGYDHKRYIKGIIQDGRPTRELINAKLIHYTQGIPAWPETETCDYSKEWRDEHKILNGAASWESIMGNSVHAVNCNGKMLPRFLFDLEKKAPKIEYAEKVKGLLLNGGNSNTTGHEGKDI